MSRRKIRALAVLAAAVGAASPVFAGSFPNLVTISISGSTAMRNFTIAPEFSALEAGKSIVLSNGTYSGGVGGLQLAPQAPASPAPAIGGAAGGGVRVEWHEAGSVEGILELANDQIGYFSNPIVDPNTTRDPTGGNPIRTNRNNVTTLTGGTAAFNGFGYNTSSYNTYANYTITGSNTQNGQNRVQFAISDVVHTQGFSRAGTGAFNKIPGQDGYGKGNPALNPVAGITSGIGTVNSRQQLTDESLLNMESTKIDPATGAAYGVGAWNTAGTGNLVSKTVAITATLMAANPGTGLTNINKSDARSLQALGRLPNGVDFNVVVRDVNSGTRNVAAANVGLDPSFATGENDGGNGFDQTAISTGGASGVFGTDAIAQASIGPAIKFSAKTAGGGQLRPTVQNARMAIGHLSISDARSANAAVTNSSTVPLRGLGLSNSEYVSGVDSSFVPVVASASTITDGSYIMWQKQQYVFVKRPDATGYTADGAYKGDIANTGGNIGNLATGAQTGNVTAFTNRIFDSITNFPNPTNGFTPADGLLAQSFILPAFMIVDKTRDGAATTDISGNTSTLGGGTTTQTNAQWRTQFTASSFANNFSINAPGAQMAGAGSFYGVALAANPSNGTNVNTVVGTLYTGTNRISITANNWLFGDFNQNGIRDLSAIKAAMAAQAALEASGLGTSMYTGTNNNVAVSGVSSALAATGGQNGAGGTTVAGATKGDLIVLGDYNGDGQFTGKDLFAIAFTAASDSTSTDSLSVAGTRNTTAFNNNYSAALRNGVLRKNAALDFFRANATATQNSQAAVGTSAAAVFNAFNKADINRDGLVNFNDALLIDDEFGKDARDLQASLNATFDATTGKPNITTTPAALNLWAVKLVDGSSVVGQADADVISASTGADQPYGLVNTVQNYTWTGTTTKSSAANFTVSPAAGSVITVANGSTFTLSGGSLTVRGAVSLFQDTTTGATPAITNNAQLTVSPTVASTILTKIASVSTGTTTVDGAGTATVAANGTPANYGTGLSLAGSTLALTGTAKLTLNARTAGNRATVSDVGSLSLASGTLLDVTSNILVVHNGSLATLQGYENSGLLTTTFTAPDFDGNPTQTLAIFQNTNQYFTDVGRLFGRSLTKLALTANDYVITVAKIGDVNLDNILDGQDYKIVNEAILFGPIYSGWIGGDLDGNGVVNNADLTILTNAFGLGSPTEVNPGDVSAIPEPSALGLLAAAIPFVSRRRRSK